TAPSLLDPSPALPSRRSPPRGGPRRSRSQTFRTTTSRFASPVSCGNQTTGLFSKVPLPNARTLNPIAIASAMAASSSQWLPLLPNFEHADLVSGSQHARKSFGEGEVGLAAKGPFHWAQPTYF